ncbi:MAG: beta-N-acetylhexosaminidase [Bacteroidota bacterium]
MNQESTRPILALLLSCVFLVLLSCKPSGPPTDLTKEGVIPKPVSVVATGGRFSLTDDSNIYVEGEELKQIGQYLADKLNRSTGFDIQVSATKGAPESGNIYLTISGADAQLGEEGYELTITKDLIKLSAPKSAGLFRGIQTIRQILPNKIELTSVQQGPWEVATGTIRDYPTYSWRGSMLDVARHFFSVEDVKRYIDLISFYKMNVMHLHLSDDQGWRIEIKSWPNLATHGGSTQVGGGKGGFYTQEQYSDIVAYAQNQFITIIPEIDLPGHINSALASYGELNGGTIVPIEGRVKVDVSPKNDLGIKNKPTELYMGIEVGWSTLRVEKEVTFKFVDDVIRELAAITSGPYLHIGGDEAHVTKKEDYIVFINRFQEMVKAHGKKMIGWEEIAQGNINSDAIAQHWTSPKYALMTVEKGAMVLMSPSKKTYIDMQYDSTTKLGQHWAAYIEVDSAYNWDPATNVEGVTQANIVGVEAPLWSETLTNMDEIEYMAFPRLPGYAEIGWTPVANRSWDEYKVRLGKHGERMKALDIDFYRSKLVPWVD